MVSTPTMNPINCRNGKIVAAFGIVENETVWESKNTWDLYPISPLDLKTTVIDEREWPKLKGVDLLKGFSPKLAPTRKWLFFQDILMLERLSRDILNENYAEICNGIQLYMANNPFALMRSCFVEGGEWDAYAIRLPARNGGHFFWIKGAPKLIKEGHRYEMIRWMGLAAEFEMSIERKQIAPAGFEMSMERSDSEQRKTKMTGKRKTLLLVRRNLGNECEILINQEYDHLRVNETTNSAEIIEIKTWKKGEEEASKEINNSSFYSVSKLLDLEVVVLWNKKSREFPWKKCLVESTMKYQIAPEKLTKANRERLNEGNEAIRRLVNALHRNKADVIYFTIKNKNFKLYPSTTEEFMKKLEPESKIGDYVKSTIEELKRHHEDAEKRPGISNNCNEVTTSMNEYLLDNVPQQTSIPYATVVKRSKEINKEVFLPEKHEVDQLPVEALLKNQSRIKDQVKGKFEPDKLNQVLVDNGKTSRTESNGIVSESDDNVRSTTHSTCNSSSYVEVAKKQKAINKNMSASEEKKTFVVDENNFPPLGGNIAGKGHKKAAKNQGNFKLRFQK